jgi:hypothetical protein
VEKRLEKYSSIHDLPEQRFYNFLGLACGADPHGFADVVELGTSQRDAPTIAAANRRRSAVHGSLK